MIRSWEMIRQNDQARCISQFVITSMSLGDHPETCRGQWTMGQGTIDNGPFVPWSLSLRASVQICGCSAENYDGSTAKDPKARRCQFGCFYEVIKVRDLQLVFIALLACRQNKPPVFRLQTPALFARKDNQTATEKDRV